MSYDITFWKPKPGAAPDPQSTYERLNRNEGVDDLEALPLPQVIEKLKEEFPDYDPTEEFPDVELEDGSMEISYTAQSFRFDFRPPTAPEKGQVWRLMSRFGCVCYDPQTGKVYDRENPPEYADSESAGIEADLPWLMKGGKATALMDAEGLLARSFLRIALPLLPKLLLFLFAVSCVLAAVITTIVYFFRWVISLFAVSVRAAGVL